MVLSSLRLLSSTAPSAVNFRTLAPLISSRANTSRSRSLAEYVAEVISASSIAPSPYPPLADAALRRVVWKPSCLHFTPGDHKTWSSLPVYTLLTSGTQLHLNTSTAKTLTLLCRSLRLSACTAPKHTLRYIPASNVKSKCCVLPLLRRSSSTARRMRTLHSSRPALQGIYHYLQSASETTPRTSSQFSRTSEFDLSRQRICKCLLGPYRIAG